MSEDQSTEGSSQRSWLERIGLALAGEPQTRNELKVILREAEQRHVLDPDALAMIEGVMQVSEMQVRDIMIPRANMVCVQKDQSPEEFLPKIIESQHSRIPVTGDDRGEVAGILLAKDLLGYFAHPDPNFRLKDILREPVVVPESKRLDSMLKDFRSSRNHMAIVVDEYGVVSGLVTIEDVLEQIVGEIEDEHDFDEDTYIFKLSNNEYTIKAVTSVEDFNEYFDETFSDEAFDTIGGLVLDGFSRVPERGDTIQLGRFLFEVQRADKRRIYLLKAVIQEEPAAS